MLKMLKMDLYRMIKNKSTWIIIGITTFFVAFPVLMQGLVLKSSDVKLLETIEFKPYVLSFIGQLNPILLITIFIALFYGSIYKTGFIKNVANFADKKYNFIVSTVVVSIIYILLVFITVFVVAYISIWIGYGNVTFDEPGLFFKTMSVQFILYGALATLAVLICTFIRKSGGAMAVCVLYFSGFGINLWQLLSMAIQYLFKTDFNICDYLVSFNLLNYNMMKAASAQWWHAPIIGLCYFVVFLVVTAYLMDKREID